MKEIGSEYWTGCTPRSNDPNDWPLMRPALYADFKYGVVECLSGRTAIEHATEQMIREGVKSIYLPSYCCHTMIEPFVKHGFDVLFYNVVVGANGLERKIDNTVEFDALFLIDYFGHVDKETAEIARAYKNKVLIYDATHSMYSDIDMKPYNYVCGSYRKWVDINCGFIAKQGGFAGGSSTQHSVEGEYYSNLRTTLFNLKADYMNGMNGVQKDDFLSLIGRAEEYLELNYSHGMPDTRSMEQLRYADIYFLKRRRRENAKFLMRELQNLNCNWIKCLNSTVEELEVPLFVPIMVEGGMRNELRKHLISKEIYCPVHWPLSDAHNIQEEAKAIYDTELSIICDQRYDLNNMARIIESIKEFVQSKN